MDKLILKGIRFHGYHGVPEAERQVGGSYEIDAILGCALKNSGSTDALADTIDYAEVVARIVEIGTQHSFQLIEALAEKIATPNTCLLYTSPSPRDRTRSRMPSSA